MKYSLFLLIAIFYGFTLANAQEPDGVTFSRVDSLITRIKAFQKEEHVNDSLLGKPLGRNLEEDFARRYHFYDSVKLAITQMSRKGFSTEEEINIELLNYIVDDEISIYTYKAYLNPILSDEGFHTSLAAMGEELMKDKIAAQEYISRLRDVPRYIEEHLGLMSRGLALGICQPVSILDGYENTYTQHIVTDAEKSVFYKPFQQKPYGVSSEEWNAFQEEAKSAILQYVVKGFQHIKVFFDKEYLPKTRRTIGVSNFPDGLAYYADRVAHYTTTNSSYEEVYRMGLGEVERIKGEMLEVMKELKFSGSMQSFFNFLRTDPRFYVTSPAQLLKEASYIAKKADAALPAMFGKLPRQPYGVEAVPDYLAPTYTTGRYSGASIQSRRAGSYWVNTSKLNSRPLYVLESLTLHEAVPGHHLQAALSLELDHLPEFRRDLYVNAFGEGWGLYCEYLGTEMGFYKDPYAHFGRLTYEMWRACRLVIDVGLHIKGWTRDQAVAYLAENTALSLHEVNTEINRYISWPGQALAYKTGELKIRELRKKAEEELKDKFDIRAFHDLVLSQGTVTLFILEKMVDRYIEEKRM